MLAMAVTPSSLDWAESAAGSTSKAGTRRDSASTVRARKGGGGEHNMQSHTTTQESMSPMPHRVRYDTAPRCGNDGGGVGGAHSRSQQHTRTDGHEV